jgi:hypothetical protein
MPTPYNLVGLSHEPTAASAVGLSSCLALRSKTAKSAKKLHPKSRSRDAAFIRSFKELAKSGRLGTAFLSLVCSSMYMRFQKTPPCSNLMHLVCLLLSPFFMLSHVCRIDLFDSLLNDHKTQDHAVVRTVR